MVFNDITQTATQGFTYSGNPTGFDSVNVTDDNGTPGDTGDDRSFGPFSDDGSDGYTQTFDCSSDPEDYTDGTYSYSVTNTASIDETGGSDTATVQVNCYLPLVTKTADTSFTRTYNWTIDKDALDADDHSIDAGGLMLADGESYNLEWQITADLDSTTPYTDNAWAVDGTVTVANPAPPGGPSMTVDVTDVFTPDGGSGQSVVLDCDPVTSGDQNTGIEIAANDSVDCTYHLDTSDATDGVNEATATLDTGASNSGTADVDFSSADITEVNATIQVTDMFNGGSEEVLGTVTKDEAPKTFSYYTLLSSDPTDNPDALLACGEQTLTNRTDIYNYKDDTRVRTLGCHSGCVGDRQLQPRLYPYPVTGRPTTTRSGVVLRPTRRGT